MVDKFYAEIFNHNGASYHQAMQQCPDARDEEFSIAVSLLNLNSGDRLLDVPAGGGYLKPYLPESIAYQTLEFSKGFNAESQIQHCSETNLGIDEASVEKAICLAAMHHVENKLRFVQELRRSLVNGGTLLIGDVVMNSKEARFLNGFVNDWSSLGHCGDFIDFERDTRLLQSAGFTVQKMTKHYHWNFDSEESCNNYLRDLFALDQQPTPTLLSQETAKLGINRTHSSFHLSWSLGFILATVVNTN